MLVIWAGPGSSDWCPYETQETETRATESRHLKTEAAAGLKQPQAKKRPEPQEAGRATGGRESRAGLSPGASEGAGLCLDFRLPASAVLSHPVCGHLLQQLQGTHTVGED